MINAELYKKHNTLQKRDALQCLEKHAKEIKWNKYGDTVIDIGCGDGSVTIDLLKTFLPKNCKELIGCDISEEMVQFANEHHARDFISFTVLDIEGNLPDQFREKFDHVFSFNCLHWVKHPEIAFSNIYDLLVVGGDCLLLFLSYHPAYEVWRELARAPRWNSWMEDVDCFVTPYQDCQDPEKEIKIMMSSIGFTNMAVKCRQQTFVYTSIALFQNAMKAVLPFKIPLEMQDDFWEDFDKVVRDMKLVDYTKDNVEGTFGVKLNYKLITVCGKKYTNQPVERFQ